MPTKLNDIRKNRMARNLTVVRNMHVGHDPVVVPQSGYADVLHGSTIDRNELAYRVAVTDFKRGVFAAILLILWWPSHGCVMMDRVLATNTRAALEHDVGSDPRAFANLDLRSNDAEWSDRDPRRELCARVDDCPRIDHRAIGAPIGRSAHRRSASVTKIPSTRALQENFPIPRRLAPYRTSISN